MGGMVGDSLMYADDATAKSMDIFQERCATRENTRIMENKLLRQQFRNAFLSFPRMTSRVS